MKLNDDEVYFILYMFIILLAILLIIAFVNNVTADDYMEKSIYAKSWDFNNGDLLIVSYNVISGKFVSSFSKSIWSHTGMVWVDPETKQRYVLEGAIYRHRKYKHFMKIPLETWLYFNKKNVIGYKKYHGPPIDSKFMWKKFNWLHRNCKLDGFNIMWAKFLIQKDYYEYSRKNNYTCIEATIIYGQEIGIFKKEKIYTSYLPGDVANNRIPLCKNIYYDLPIEIHIHPTDLCLLKDDIKIFDKWWKN